MHSLSARLKFYHRNCMDHFFLITKRLSSSTVFNHKLHGGPFLITIMAKIERKKEMGKGSRGKTNLGNRNLSLYSQMNSFITEVILYMPHFKRVIHSPSFLFLFLFFPRTHQYSRDTTNPGQHKLCHLLCMYSYSFGYNCCE